MNRVKDITLYDCGRANTTDLWLQCVNHNYRAGLYKHDTAGAQSSLDWIFFFNFEYEILSELPFEQNVSSEKLNSFPLKNSYPWHQRNRTVAQLWLIVQNRRTKSGVFEILTQRQNEWKITISLSKKNVQRNRNLKVLLVTLRNIKTRLNNMWKFTSYYTEHTMRPQYKYRLINAA